MIFYYIVVFYDIRDLWIIYGFIDFSYRYYQNSGPCRLHWVTLHFWVSHLKVQPRNIKIVKSTA